MALHTETATTYAVSDSESQKMVSESREQMLARLTSLIRDVRSSRLSFELMYTGNPRLPDATFTYGLQEMNQAQMGPDRDRFIAMELLNIFQQTSTNMLNFVPRGRLETCVLSVKAAVSDSCLVW